VWGLSDYHLFSEANRVLREKKSPFFAFIQSSSFHRPYSIPEDKEGFERVSFKGQSDSLKKYGFISEDEFNSMRFQDYSLGHFFELAKKEAYYKDTVFFIFGDHGLPGSGGKNIPIGEKASGLPSFHVPFLIHGPKYFSAGVDNRFVSELDVFPTIAGLFGKPFENFSLGRNIFDPQFDDKRQVFTFRWYARPPRYGILEKDFFYEETLGKEGNLTRYSDKKNYDKDMRSKYPEKFEQLKNLARGMYQTSKFMLFNNKRGILEKKGK
jgi:phosphoglycerol transferase MdoB-like AlkP superfamily enzyme